MSRPYMFDHIVKDPEDGESIELVIEVENEDHYFCFDKKSGMIVQMSDLPQEDLNQIRERIQTHFFMNDAYSGWAADV